MDAELVADAVLLADPVQRDPGPRRVGDVVVEVVTRCPSGHRALLHPERQPARLVGGDDLLGNRRAAVSGPYAGLWGNGWFMLSNPVYGPGMRGTLDEVIGMGIDTRAS